jgi:hypothetical protein
MDQLHALEAAIDQVAERVLFGAQILEGVSVPKSTLAQDHKA